MVGWVIVRRGTCSTSLRGGGAGGITVEKIWELAEDTNGIEEEEEEGREVPLSSLRD